MLARAADRAGNNRPRALHIAWLRDSLHHYTDAKIAGSSRVVRPSATLGANSVKSTGVKERKGILATRLLDNTFPCIARFDHTFVIG